MKIKFILLNYQILKKKDKLIITNNTSIVIGIIGAISIIKGKYILEKIINFFDNSTLKLLYLEMLILIILIIFINIILFLI